MLGCPVSLTLLVHLYCPFPSSSWIGGGRKTSLYPGTLHTYRTVCMYHLRPCQDICVATSLAVRQTDVSRTIFQILRALVFAQIKIKKRKEQKAPKQAILQVSLKVCMYRTEVHNTPRRHLVLGLQSCLQSHSKSIEYRPSSNLK